MQCGAVAWRSDSSKNEVAGHGYGHRMDIDHLLGGAAMGPEGDAAAVVGEDCRVRGVEGLRVADLSIVPVPLRSPTAFDAMMIGEHAAALILAAP
ncbi:GMC oxidoreductase [Nonomuraea sp. LP-02]|uniref:GMC oxidoreductase n=1 Tax=Nonomuraea sp. LP-02 TaxID=3097960 RepID=UPI002E31073F|nr:GMC oxidoreductase [Nonomuraea sp. LP-02]MED7923969.1 GMC oxidoreductase [Nonomuraea sp. LP-02]